MKASSSASAKQWRLQYNGTTRPASGRRCTRKYALASHSDLSTAH
jgi:hypothetical protein